MLSNKQWRLLNIEISVSHRWNDFSIKPRPKASLESFQKIHDYDQFMRRIYRVRLNIAYLTSSWWGRLRLRVIFTLKMYTRRRIFSEQAKKLLRNCVVATINDILNLNLKKDVTRSFLYNLYKTNDELPPTSNRVRGSGLKLTVYTPVKLIRMA